MKAEQFNKEFTVDRAARTPRATAKHAPIEYPIALTGDGLPFNHEATYFFFDGEKVRASTGLRRVSAEHIGRLGYRAARINQLRADHDNAVVDAQLILLEKVRKLKEQISNFEQEKRPENRTTKFRLMARE